MKPSRLNKHDQLSHPSPFRALKVLRLSKYKGGGSSLAQYDIINRGVSARKHICNSNFSVLHQISLKPTWHAAISEITRDCKADLFQLCHHVHCPSIANGGQCSNEQCTKLNLSWMFFFSFFYLKGKYYITVWKLKLRHHLKPVGI